ncbi:MAG TPA: FtsX-like permease family protein [Steroidobacteraceae bacterium]|nr:FtsX-like permease family protein [Steroidobacteraceae bacterium]
MAAFLLFGALESIRSGIVSAAERLQNVEILVAAKGNRPLPMSYPDKIRQIDGVREAIGLNYLPGLPPGEEREQIVAGVVEPDVLLRAYPSFSRDSAALKRWREVKAGALVKAGVAAKHGSKVGDRIPLRSMIPRRDNSGVWELTLVGTFKEEEDLVAPDMLVRLDYYTESALPMGDLVANVVVLAKDYRHVEAVSHAIDAAFANAPVETRSTPMSAMIKRSIVQMGNVGTVLIAVMSASFFTVLLVSANALWQSVRERVGEFAVLQTVGFQVASIGWIVLAEMLAIIIGGGVVGLALEALLSKFSSLFSPLELHTIGLGLAAMVVFSLVAAALPILQASRISIVGNLRRA